MAAHLVYGELEKPHVAHSYPWSNEIVFWCPEVDMHFAVLDEYGYERYCEACGAALDRTIR